MRAIPAVLVSLMLFGFVSVSDAAKGDFNIGWIDMQRTLQSVEAGKKAKKSFETEVAKLRDNFQKEEKKLKDEEEQLRKQDLVLSEKAKREKAIALQQKIVDFQKRFQDEQMKMQRREQELTMPIIQALVNVVEEISKQDSLTYVLERAQSSLVYAEASRDITDTVIARYNKLYDKDGKRRK